MVKFTSGSTDFIEGFERKNTEGKILRLEETAMVVYGENARTTLPDGVQVKVIDKIKRVRAENLMVWNKNQEDTTKFTLDVEGRDNEDEAKCVTVRRGGGKGGVRSRSG